MDSKVPENLLKISAPLPPYPSVLNPFESSVEISPIIPTVSSITPPNPNNANNSGLINPNYSQFNELPPSYSSQTTRPHQSHHVISASTLANSAIFMNGRSPVALVCQFCENSVLTVTTEIRSPVLSARHKGQNCFLIGITLTIFAIFIIVSLLSGTLIPVFVMPGFILFMLVAFIGVSRSRQRVAQVYSDVHHSCPVCKNKLGVSNGLQMLQMTHAHAGHRGRAPGF